MMFVLWLFLVFVSEFQYIPRLAIQFPADGFEGREASPAWLPVIMMIILAECFAIGVKMKEEQDLTI